MPFVITKISDTSRSIEELGLEKEELLLAADFLLDGRTIPDLKTLANSLFQKRKLYCTSYRTKDEVNKYYQFLYEKQILSINLSVSENLKAFAKVIQSFSKAETLDLKPASASRSLKQFLFEESDAELIEDYSLQQHALEKLLREYSSLDKYIKILEQKQQGLTQLKRLDKDIATEKRALLLSKLNNTYNNLQSLNRRENETRCLLEVERENLTSFERKRKKLPKIKDLIRQAIAKAEADYDLHNDYQKSNEETEILEKHITELRIIGNQLISESWKKGIDMIDINSRSLPAIRELVQSALPIIKKYQDLAAIEAAREKQQKEIQQMTQALNTELNSTRNLIQLIESSSTDSIIQWVVKQNKPLTNEQEAIVMHFAHLPTKKPKSAEKNDRYVIPHELIYEAGINGEQKKNGLWITLGPVHEFIETNSDEKIFDDPDNFHQSIVYLLNLLKTKQQSIEIKLSEVDKINKSKPYNRQLISRDFDLDLIEYSKIEKVREGVACMLQISEKISQLKSEKQEIEEKMQRMLTGMSVSPDTTDPDVLRKELRAIKARQYQRNNRHTRFETKLDSSIETASAKEKQFERDLVEGAREIIKEQKEFDNQNLTFFAEFSENITAEQLSMAYEAITIIELRYEDLLKQYRVKYHDLVNRFEETQQEKSVPINMEINERSYRFSVLEHALLGNKITYTDDIGAALADANAGRLNMAEDMKNSMVKIFDKTLKRYKKYKELVQLINDFFKGKRISDRFYFNVDFSENKTVKIEFVEEIGARLRYAAKQGELPFDKPVNEFIEEFFRKAARMNERLPIDKLLSPKTYFDLSVSLTDENRNEIPGSTGETYSAIALLGIARLSLVQTEKRKGIRFIILEEIGSLDNTNYNTFPTIAKEYGYQIITMAPQPFRTSLADEWYAHHLIKGKVDSNINYHPSASYFKTKEKNQDLMTYLKLRENELD